ncbi:exodeoxyribonuclease 7 small subunit [Bacillus cereus]|uniref:Exodeoxyribonuclease 7 small subunit n=2 Tax=Bacillus cereus group TaxID=86661 RepID=A0A1J9VFT6_9BACI|nr:MULTISPECIES: exodeoxyribonuclease VII small subunit [Bacillus]EJR52343.1 exodeoxyribonuclease 7 small subunit [Bacillus cereus VD107]PFD45804.1 exodeoxyribonuclease 7 small subunit [Bacillus cereus]KFN01289.1 exodeoxyribonuclease VII, small subunit [Bacillus clarus]KMN44151.1 exodeoxyribonuclease VII small subunit [Bacillus sp. LK2]MCW9131375.1 exodeoxyribonuclease VII small subunit [Bacillus paramycoides]
MENKLSFEEAISQLEHLVSKLEQGDVPLEEAISYFKEGMELSKLCDEKLKDVQEQMAVILGEDGELEPFTALGDEA